MLNVDKYVLCIFRCSCQNPAMASSIENIWHCLYSSIFFSFQISENLSLYIFSTSEEPQFLRSTDNFTFHPNTILSGTSTSKNYPKSVLNLFEVCFNGFSHYCESCNTGYLQPYTLLCWQLPYPCKDVLQLFLRVLLSSSSSGDSFLRRLNVQSTLNLVRAALTHCTFQDLYFSDL